MLTFMVRIEVVSEVDGLYRALDLQKPKVRAAVYAAASERAVYQGPAPATYQS
jgi:hypothetical protein